MRIHLWGTDYKRTHSELRNQLWIDPIRKLEFVQEAIKLGFKDLLILSTCNRVEFFTTAHSHAWDSRNLFIQLLNKLGLPESVFYQGYHLEGKGAVRHILRVSSSLESMVLGEPQILGQMKEMLRWNQESGLPLSSAVKKLFEFTFEVAKRVRTETDLGAYPVSVASVAFDVLNEVEVQVPVESVVLVGRSEMTKQIAEAFIQKNPLVPILWVNRDVEKLQTMLKNNDFFKNVRIGSLSAFIDKPEPFSHLVTSTSGREILFGESFFRKAGGNRKVVIDLAEPADVDVDYVEKDNRIHLIGLRDVELLSERNSKKRAMAVCNAEAIIIEMLEKYLLQQKENPVMREFQYIEPLWNKWIEECVVGFRETGNACPESLEGHLRKMSRRGIHEAREMVKKALHAAAEEQL